METITTRIIADYVDALRASHWTVQLKNRLTEQAFRFRYTTEQLVKAVPFLGWRNREGFDVYARPVGWHYVLLDDLTPEVLQDLAEVKPCVLLETSPANYQAWLLLAQIPADRNEALAICRELAHRFKADLASADPDHVGRLPGFTNRKAKHQLPNRQYPYVRLHRSEYRLSTFHPCGGGVLKEKLTNEYSRPHRTRAYSQSEKDFGIACGLIRKGLTDEQILTYLLKHSPDLQARKGSKHVLAYLEKTIRKAHVSLIQ